MPKPSFSTATPQLEIAEAAWEQSRLGFSPRARHAAFLVSVLLSVAWCWQSVVTVSGRSLSGEYEHYSHIFLLPFISAYLMYLNRHAILRHAQSRPATGLLIAAAGVAATWLAGTTILTSEPEYRLSMSILGLVTLWVGGFVLCYGLRAFGTVTYPFLLLLLMVPLPPSVLNAVIEFLQRTSAEASAFLFALIGMPVFREGFLFALPGLTIEVAKECSGIRSSLALLIIGLAMGYLCLRATWARLTFALLIIPLAIAKNAVRIVALSWLAVHVDPSFITGSAVHRTSGIPVFVASLAALGALVLLLQRAEAWKSR